MTDTPETTLADAEVVQETNALARQPVEPGSILSIIKEAVLNKADVETMRELLAIRREERADQAAEAFANALVMFRRLVKPIIMTGERDDRKTSTTGKVHYKFAELTTTIEQIQPALDQCGLTPTWRMVKSERDWVEIECVVTHALRHKETSMPLGAKPEGPPGQTDAQRRSGTITTLQRKTLFMALGLTTKEDDRHLKDQEQGVEPKKPKTQQLMDETKAQAEGKLTPRQQFIQAVRAKLDSPDLPLEIAGKLYRAAVTACATDDYDTCRGYIERDDVMIAANGTLSVVTDTGFEELPPDDGDQSSAGPDGPPTDGAFAAPSTQPDPPAFKFQCPRCGKQMPVKPASGLCPGDGLKKCLGKVVEIQQ